MNMRKKLMRYLEEMAKDVEGFAIILLEGDFALQSVRHFDKAELAPMLIIKYVIGSKSRFFLLVFGPDFRDHSNQVLAAISQEIRSLGQEANFEMLESLVWRSEGLTSLS